MVDGCFTLTALGLPRIPEIDAWLWFEFSEVALLFREQR